MLARINYNSKNFGFIGWDVLSGSNYEIQTLAKRESERLTRLLKEPVSQELVWLEKGSRN